MSVDIPVGTAVGESDYADGCVLVVDKPLGWTSTDVVRKIKFALRRRGLKKVKVGHAGTLDPLASGVLLVCVGKATKMVESLQSERKEYVAGIMLGATTPSYDMEHPVDARYPWEHVTRDDVERTLENLCGEQHQLPPAYSAKMIDGRRAYEYAREGTEVDMRTALVNIYALELLECDLPRIRIRVECSKGTYIRSLARDIGKSLGSGAYLTSLRRTRSGGFTEASAEKIENLVEKISLS